MEARLTAQSLDGAHTTNVAIGFAAGVARVTGMSLAAPPAPGGALPPVECAFARVLEARISLASMGVTPPSGLRFQLSVWEGGLPIDAVPQQGWLEIHTTDPGQMAVY